MRTTFSSNMYYRLYKYVFMRNVNLTKQKLLQRYFYILALFVVLEKMNSRQMFPVSPCKQLLLQ